MISRYGEARRDGQTNACHRRQRYHLWFQVNMGQSFVRQIPLDVLVNCRRDKYRLPQIVSGRYTGLLSKVVVSRLLSSYPPRIVFFRPGQPLSSLPDGGAHVYENPSICEALDRVSICLVKDQSLAEQVYRDEVEKVRLRHRTTRVSR